MKKRLRRKIDFKVKLILTFSLLLIIPPLLIGSFAYFSAKDAIEHEMLAGFNENLKLLNSTIDNEIQAKIHDVEYFSENLILAGVNEESVEELRESYDEYIQLHPEAQALYFGGETGVFIREPNIQMPPDYDPRERGWYKNAMDKKGEVIISDPYISASTKDIVITVSKTNGDFSGVVGIDVSLSYLQELTSQVQIGHNGFASILDKNFHYISHPTKDYESELENSLKTRFSGNVEGRFIYDLEGENYEFAYVTNELTGWKVTGIVASKEISNAAQPIFKSTALILVIALLTGTITVFFIIKSIIKPLKELKHKATIISQGNLTANIEVNSSDEIGQLGMAFNKMGDSLTELVKKVESGSEHVAASSEELLASAEQTSLATEQVATSIQEVATSTEKQTIAVEKNIQSLEIVSQGVTLIANHSKQVSELAKHTVIQSQIGGQAVSETVEQMDDIQISVSESNEKILSLYEQSKKVGSILDVITGIADQTNLLALNAAIEAARAGEHGKGFAVVAGEVRRLAEQSQQSASEIYDIVRKIQVDTEDSVQIMGRVNENVKNGVQISKGAIEKFKQILKCAEEMTPQIEIVNDTAQQMSIAAQEVIMAGNDLNIIAQENAATSEEVAAATEEQLASMEEITASAQALSKMADDLKEVISKFTY